MMFSVFVYQTSTFKIYSVNCTVYVETARRPRERQENNRFDGENKQKNTK